MSGDAFWGFIFSAGVASGVGIPLYLNGHTWPATVTGCVFMALWGIPLAAVPLGRWAADKLEGRLILGRAVREAKSQATVEEINLRHQLEMERIRFKLRAMYVEDGVEIPNVHRSVRKRG